ncbi:ammonia-dependent NAD(+) synthetase [Citricoccus nitrophenolicus]|uniref:ammonia-dependent NAD(+) synthetase n=1 Tax=Citricoccus nitrophenolicus TaxID=863575 RepID=UPI0039B3BDE3
MRELQRAIIAEMGVRPEIDPATEITERVTFLQDYLRSAGARGFVLGISGGLDSTLAGRLAQLAVEGLRADGVDTEFVAVRLPYNVQQDEEDAQAALRFVAADEELTLGVGGAVDALARDVLAAQGEPLTDYTKGNTKARIRMTAQYALAGDRGLLVIGTDHGAESVTGFFTKFGDGGADVLPLYGLNKRQNRALLKHLGASEQLWAKAPTADLLDERPGQTDEAELGLDYDVIDDYLEGRDVPEQAAQKLEGLFLRSRHKRTTPATILDGWWR